MTQQLGGHVVKSSSLGDLVVVATLPHRRFTTVEKAIAALSTLPVKRTIVAGHPSPKDNGIDDGTLMVAGRSDSAGLEAGLRVTEELMGTQVGKWRIMQQMANTDNSSSEREEMGSNVSGAQQNAGALNPTLVARVEAAIKEQPEFGVLRAKLLEHGGTGVVPPLGWNNDLRQYVVIPDPELPALVDHGYLMDGPVVCRSRGMEPNRCHENIARLWLQKRKRDALVGIATGYCLSGHLWRQHSWGIRKDSLLETLGERENYFGIRLEGIDADVFAFKALYMEQRHWSLFSPELLRSVWTEWKRREAIKPEP